ncbi:MAG: HAD family hydrolase [Hellea sp.]|nr:HAD family hydrolase [Hellea sp.]
MWSGPRNLSTAMMRSFENRADTHVWDEPFFAPWLAATGKDHPGRAESLDAHETDPAKVAEQCQQAPPDGETLYFQKHMPHHMEADFPLAWTKTCWHFFLIRRPDAVIASYAKGRAEFDMNDIGFWPQIRMYEYLIGEGHDIPVVDSDDILDNPKGILSSLCRALDIPFDAAMLSWPAGPRDTDGAWAPWWYKSVEASTGFAPPKREKPAVPQKYQNILSECQPAYEQLYEKRITA